MFNALMLVSLVLQEPAPSTPEGSWHAVVFQREGCAAAGLLCLDGDLRPLTGERMPAAVVAGSKFAVKVLDCKDAVAGMTYALTDEAEDSPDRQSRPASSNSDGNNPRAAAKTCEAARVSVLAPARFTVPATASSSKYHVIATRTGTTPDAARIETHEARISHGRYYLDFGVMIPMVLGGKRRVVVEDAGSPGVKQLRVTEDIDVFPALMLHVFPGGREFGALSSFGGPRGPRCDRACHRRRAANALGLQVGVELDVKRFDRFFVGGLFEPVTGLSVNVGLALTRLDYLKSGHHDGSLIPTPATVTTDGAPDLRQYTIRFWAPRLYLGITLSFDIIRTLGDRRRSAALKNILPE